MITKIINGKIISQNRILENEVLYLKDDKILFIGNKDISPDKEIDAKNNYVSAGFIDIHTHGGGGADFLDGGEKPIMCAAQKHLFCGTTSIMPTTLACSKAVLVQFLNDLKAVMKTHKNIIGAHLEGPYFSKNQSGAQNPEYIKNPDPKEYNDILNIGKGIIRRWSFAPELEGSIEFCKTLVKNNVLPSCGHSDAAFDDVKAVHDFGCKMITHLYSGMSTITRKNGFRRLGVTECAYYFDDMCAEIIADGAHLPPELLKLIIKLKGTDNICLVTDSMRAAGESEGMSFLGRKGEKTPCIIEDGVAKLLDKRAFAGSVATADRLVRTMVKKADCSVTEAVKMITQNPARILNLTDRGDIKENLRADIVIFDDDINIKKVFLCGIEVK